MNTKVILVSIAACCILSCHKASDSVSISNSSMAILSVDSMLTNIVDSIIKIDTLPGIDYLDRIYSVDDSVDEDRYATPYYTNAPCILDATGTSGCIFDETDLDGDGKSDYPGINKNKLVISSESGIIDLLASLQSGVFGLEPTNGQKNDFTFYYRVNDDSRRSLKKITVRLLYYKTITDVPDHIKREIKKRQDEYAAATSLALSTSVSLYTIYKPKRPPLLVVISSR